MYLVINIDIEETLAIYFAHYRNKISGRKAVPGGPRNSNVRVYIRLLSMEKARIRSNSISNLIYIVWII